MWWSIVPGKKMKSIKKPSMYESLKNKRGMSKRKAAAISNAAANGTLNRKGGGRRRKGGRRR